MLLLIDQQDIPMITQAADTALHGYLIPAPKARQLRIIGDGN